ncbi:MAG TPA: hypothetical protein VFB13_05300 [Reyranella sp.]|jgi:hypothetical protein|nr:hypothetical protein [Reyranella sp.]
MTDMRELAEGYSAEALHKIAELMREAASEQVRLAAARELLDRAHGKPRGESGGPPGKTLAELIDEANGATP